MTGDPDSPRPAPPAHPLARALPLFLFAGLCLSSLDATAKYMVRDHSLFLVVWARYAGQMLVVTPFAWHRAGPGFWRTRRPGLQLFRSAMLLIATCCFFGALRYLPIAEASAITFLAPILIVLMSGPLLGERPSLWRWVASITGFIGILILLRPGLVGLSPGDVAAHRHRVLQCALPGAHAQAAGRERAHDALLQRAGGNGACSPSRCRGGLPTAALPGATARCCCLLGAFAGVGHWAIIGAFLRAPASLLTPFTYLQMVWAVGYGYLIFGQLPDQWSAIGMSVIVASGLLLALQERQRRR